jgi:lauroyl/myristoyl acyltransferase
MSFASGSAAGSFQFELRGVLRVEPLPAAEPQRVGGDDAADDYNFTLQATRIIEETIRRYPDEWLWFQKRWNTKWAGEQA